MRRLRAAVRVARAGLASRADALEALVGVGLITAGVAWFSIGAALIVAGASVLAFTVLRGRA